MPEPAPERHLLVTRFAVPRPVPGTAELYRDPSWLEGRFELFRRWFVPSVERLGVPLVLLCGRAVAETVAARVADLAWARVEVQDDWRGGFRGATDQTLTRIDSDDALRGDWFETLDRAPREARILVTPEFLRYDPRSGRLHRYRRREPSPLAAFRGGENPYAVDHKHLLAEPGVRALPGAFLLQIVHGGNVSNHPPSPWRLDRRTSLARLADYGLSPAEV
ncbi:MAG: hypothetical protein KDB94_02635 [Acidobacteria bacterium]|nr:hypothetical protein [Acidobacteriota bacterium]MCB9378577.1 hypothetical protein [Holophagales bacterium]